MSCHDDDRLPSCVRDGRSSALRVILSLFFLELNFSACTEFADRSFGEASLRTLPHHEPSISSVTRVMGPNSKLLTYKVCRCSSVGGILIYRVCLHKLSSPSGITRVMLSSASLAASYGWCESVSANVRITHARRRRSRWKGRGHIQREQRREQRRHGAEHCYCVCLEELYRKSRDNAQPNSTTRINTQQCLYTTARKSVFDG